MSGNVSIRQSALIFSLLLTAPLTEAASAQQSRLASPSIAERTTGMRRLDGFFPLYWDSTSGRLHLEIARTRFNQEVLNVMGLASGLGSNDIGLDRGQLQDSRIVFVERDRFEMRLRGLCYGDSSSWQKLTEMSSSISPTTSCAMLPTWRRVSRRGRIVWTIPAPSSACL
jgi:hypothetical protein